MRNNRTVMTKTKDIIYSFPTRKANKELNFDLLKELIKETSGILPKNFPTGREYTKKIRKESEKHFKSAWKIR